nr:MAG TPA: hypothetical protein [Caudoviricetes sp.]
MICDSTSRNIYPAAVRISVSRLCFFGRSPFTPFCLEERFEQLCLRRSKAGNEVSIYYFYFFFLL